jgi:hypothetical protein
MRIGRAAITLIGITLAGCMSVEPSSSAATFSTLAPTPSSRTPEPAPSTVPPGPSASSVPPYTITSGRDKIEQQPGTILFGSLPGPLSDGVLEPYLTWPEDGLTIDADVAFGAFWGRPLEASNVTVTLYRVVNGTTEPEWSRRRDADAAATGFLGTLPGFKRPGTYRLEVTRGSELLAWGVAQMGPACTSNCSGG